MEKKEDPDQKAPLGQPDLGLHCLHAILSNKFVHEILGQLEQVPRGS